MKGVIVVDRIKLNRIYVCNDKESLEQYRIKLNDAIKNKASYPSECILPEIYIEGNQEIDSKGSFGEPYYSEIDINLINSTNTSSCKKVYSNYDRVINSIPYIIKNECKPIAVLKDGDNYCIINGKHRFLAYTLLGKKFCQYQSRKEVVKKKKGHAALLNTGENCMMMRMQLYTQNKYWSSIKKTNHYLMMYRVWK